MKLLVRPRWMKSAETQPAEPGVGNLGTLIIFILVCGLTLAFFYLYPILFGNRSATSHFLVNMPLPGLEDLDLLYGPQGITTPTELNDEIVMIIIWAPWDTDSCRFLPQLAPVLKTFEKAPEFSVLPVAYFAAPPKKGTKDIRDAPDQYKVAKSEAMVQKEPLRIAVEHAYNQYGFSFPAVWWDPVDTFRTDMLQTAVMTSINAASQVDGIGYPTVILVQHGIIHAVWTGNSQRNVDEIRHRLIAVTGFLPPDTPDESSTTSQLSN